MHCLSASGDTGNGSVWKTNDEKQNPVIRRPNLNLSRLARDTECHFNEYCIMLQNTPNSDSVVRQTRNKLVYKTEGCPLVPDVNVP